MGIETALVAGGLGVVGNLISSSGQKKSADAALKQQNKMFQQGQEATRLQREAGNRATGIYENLITPEGQSQFYEQYMAGPQFQQFQQQAEDANLRAASATGNLRTGETQERLGSIAPQLANQAYTSRLGGLQNLMNLGAGASGQTAGLATNVGMSTSPYAGKSAGAWQQGVGDTLGQLGGMAAYYGMQPQGALPALGDPTLPAYSNQGSGRLS